MPENYAMHMDAFQFIKDVAVDWDDTKIIEEEPREYISIARKEKGKRNWFFGGYNGCKQPEYKDPARFFGCWQKKYAATIYRDSDNADWKNKPETYTSEKIMATSTSSLQLHLAEGEERQ